MAVVLDGEQEGMRREDPMLFAFDSADRRLTPVTVPPSSGWVHTVAPTEGEMALLHDRLGVPWEFLRHALDLDEVARVDRDEGGATLVVLRVPWHQGHGHELPYRSAPLGVVLLDGVLVTIAPNEAAVVDDLLATRDLAPVDQHRFLIQLVLRTAERFLADVREIDRTVSNLEDELQASLRNREVLALLRYQKALVHITTALNSDQILVDRIQKGPHLRLSPTERELLEDALVELRQAIEMTAISGNILSQMMDAFASIISNNLNIVMKVLTSLTIVLSLPVMVASFYGMNVRLPGQGHPAAFLATVGLSLLLSLGVALVFWRKRWL